MIFRLVLGALLTSMLVWADGGTIVFRQRSGPYSVTLFASPDPLRVGIGDLSVLVERASDGAPVLDAGVAIELDGEAVKATHGNATNKLLYQARVELPEAGVRPVAVRMNGAAVRGELSVLPAQTPIVRYWPYFAVVPIAVILFEMNRRLKRRRAGQRLN